MIKLLVIHLLPGIVTLCQYSRPDNQSLVGIVTLVRYYQSKWTRGSILTKIIGTYKSGMPGNSAGNYATLHEFHSLLICNGVK